LDFIEWAGQNSVFLVSGHIFDDLRGIAVKSIYEQEAANRGLGKGRWRDLFNKDKGLMSDVHNEIVRIKEAVHKAPAFEYVEYTADELFDDLTTRIMCKLGLNSMDAKLVAIGQRWGSNSVVTFDEDFAFAGGLNIFSSSWLVLRHRKDGLNQPIPFKPL